MSWETVAPWMPCREYGILTFLQVSIDEVHGRNQTNALTSFPLQKLRVRQELLNVTGVPNVKKEVPDPRWMRIHWVLPR